MKKALLLAAALLFAAVPAAAQVGAPVNPIPGSVWTYFGPTYGASWGAPGGGTPAMIYGSNPYTAVYPGGVGTSGVTWPDTHATANNTFMAGVGSNIGGALINNNVFPYGDLDTSVACSFTVGGNWPAASNGYTDYRQFGALQDADVAGCTFSLYTFPPLGPVSGTFTATTFTPNTNLTTVNVVRPFQSNKTVPLQSVLRVGMWVRTNDPIPYWGYITDPGTGGKVTVIGWVQQGSGTAGTPAGNVAIFNDERNWYTTTFNTVSTALCTGAPCTQPTGTVTNGSTTITGVNDTTGMFAGQFIQTNHLNTTVIKSVVGSTLTVYGPGAFGSSTGPESLYVSAAIGSQTRSGEVDVFNLGPGFQIFGIKKVTGCQATAGSNQLTGCSTIPNDVRPHLIIYPSNGNIVGPSSAVLSVDSATSFSLASKATATGTVDITFFQGPDELGTGWDIGANNASGQAAVAVRGNMAYGMLVHGVWDAGLKMQPDGLGPTPNFGVEVDCAIQCIGQSAYRVWNSRTGVVMADIDPAGNMSGAAATFSTMSVYYGGGASLPAGYPAYIHTAVNANLLIGSGAFFSVTGGVALAAQNDSMPSAGVPLVLFGSSVVIPNLPTACTGLATGALYNVSGAVHAC